jgi:hypothetical protein
MLSRDGAVFVNAASGPARGALRSNPPGVLDTAYGSNGFAGVQWPGGTSANEAMSIGLDDIGALLVLGITRPTFPEPQVCDYCLTRFTAAGAVNEAPPLVEISTTPPSKHWVALWSSRSRHWW